MLIHNPDLINRGFDVTGGIIRGKVGPHLITLLVE